VFNGKKIFYPVCSEVPKKRKYKLVPLCKLQVEKINLIIAKIFLNL